MIDINLIRDNSTREQVVESEKKRFKDYKKVLEVYFKDQERIKIGFELDSNNKSKNSYSKQVKDAYKKNKNIPKEEVQPLIEKFKKAEKDSEILQEKLKVLDEEVNALLKGIGNLVDNRVIVSKDEDQNPILSTFRSSRALYKAPKPYSVLMADFTYSNSGSKIVGHRGYYLSGKMAKLGRALSWRW